MRRLCVLGNSHMAAFATAAEDYAARWPEFRLDMFGAHGDVLSRFEVRDGWFQSDDAEARARIEHLVGRDSFALSDYDGFIVTGLQVSVFTFVRMFRELSSVDMPSVEGALSAMEDGRPLASKAMLRAYGAERLMRTSGMKLARILRAATEAPIFVASQPRPSGRVRERSGAYLGFIQLAARGDGEFVSDWFDREAAELCAAQRVQFIPQPAQTVEQGLFTAESFLRGSVRLARRKGLAHDEDDVLHANAEFARLMVDQVAVAMNLPIAA
ncbi:hypothetical protein [Celeribacter persicus]|uniref:Uncharacterized protein n=1 Tax=Celeribacter persicus TaxID=1651082 RepID=A0A2T5HK47_9RHOB|nr:hypothetical protein [Celeribacter persicus]PTQ71947.1 hypothetical protein C8N42_107126 [Celeribacter persicus]